MNLKDKNFIRGQHVSINSVKDLTGIIQHVYLDEYGTPKANVRLFPENVDKQWILDNQIYVSVIVCDYSNIDLLP